MNGRTLRKRLMSWLIVSTMLISSLEGITVPVMAADMGDILVDGAGAKELSAGEDALLSGTMTSEDNTKLKGGSEQEKNPIAEYYTASYEVSVPEETSVQDESAIEDKTLIEEETSDPYEVSTLEEASVQDETAIAEEASDQEEATIEEETLILRDASESDPDLPEAGPEGDIPLSGSSSGPTVLPSDRGASDGVVYYLTRANWMGAESIPAGTKLIFLSGSRNPNDYISALPGNAGVLERVESRPYGSYDWKDEWGNFKCYVRVVRSTAGFDRCPYGTLHNDDLSEYNCYRGGVEHLSGSTYNYVEYPYGSKVKVNLTMDGKPWSDARVALYSGTSKLREVIYGAGGVYDLGYWSNGTYDIYVDGVRAEAVTVNAKPQNADNLPAPGEMNSDGFRYVTDQAFSSSLSFTHPGGTTPKGGTYGAYQDMKVTIKADRSMADSEVTLRDRERQIRRVLSCSSQSGTTAVFTGSMEKSDTTEYDLYVDGQYVYEKLSPAGVSDADVTFYTTTVTVKKDNTPWTDAGISLDNGRDHYVLKVAGEGVYTADVLEGADYVLTVDGVVDPDTTTVNADNKTLTLEYYTVSYYSYVKEGEDSFTLGTSPARRQVVRSGVTTSAPSDVYIEGLSFRWYSPTPWDKTKDANAEFDYSVPITGTTTLYAQFGTPRVRINEFLRTDVNGGIDGNGGYFRIGNLTISGYEEGDRGVKSATVSVKNISSTKVVDTSGFTVKSADGKTEIGNGGSTAGGVTVKFGEGVSMAVAQAWIRENLIFTPVTGQSAEVEVSVSDKDLTVGSMTVNNQSPVSDKWTSLTGNNNLASGYYYVDSNVTYTGSTGQAGLRIASNAKVYIYVMSGKTLTATGGAGSGTTPGGAGIQVPSNSTLCLAGSGTVKATGGRAGDGADGGNGKDGQAWAAGAAGGSGGAGGGGAGAGIGTNGGNGGTAGNGGSSAAACGTICVLKGLNVAVAYGNYGQAGKGGKAGKKNTQGGGSGGDGGQGGGAGAGYGTGGTGGAGGKDGAKGTASDGKDGNTPSSPAATGTYKTPATSTTAFSANYTVTFTGAASNGTQDYTFQEQKAITVPDLGDAAGKFFLGWQVTKYGRYVGTGTPPLTTAETKYYQPGDTITLAAGTYGNITLTAITKPKVGLVATDKGDMEFAAGMPETTYHSYTLKTTLDGADRDMGPMTLKNEDGTHTLTAGADGTYTMTLSTEGSYTVSADKYPGMVAGKTAEAGGTTTIDFESLTVNVDGYEPDTVTLKTGDGEGPALAGAAANDATHSVFTALRMKQEDAPEYSVYVDGTLATAFKGSAVSAAAWGSANAVTVSYHTVTATVSGNEAVKSVELRSEDTNLALTGSGTTWSLTRMLEETPVNYTLYVNGIAFEGQTADFTEDKALTANLYRLTVNTRVDGIAGDAGEVTIGGRATTAVESGKYQLVTSDLTELSVNVGSFENVGTVSNSGAYDLTADFYTLRYKNGVEEIPAKPAGIHRAGETITVMDDTGAVPTEPFDMRTSDFEGWSYGTSIYKPGETFTMSANAVTLTSAWITKEGFGDPRPATVTEVTKTYSAGPQELAEVDDTTLTGGTMYYALGENELTAPEMTEFKQTVPTGTDVSTYYVWYRVMGDDTHSDGSLRCVSSNIIKADITPAVTLTNWTYGDTPYTPQVTGNPGNGEVKYYYKAKDADDSTYNEEVPYLAGDYTVKAEVGESANYNAGTATSEFTIEKRNITITVSGSIAQRGDAHADGNDNIIINSADAEPKTATTDTAALAEAVTAETLPDTDTLSSIILTGDTSNVGETTVSASDAVIKRGDDNVTVNYNITYVGTDNYSIIPTRPAVKSGETVTATPITYGQSLADSPIISANMVDKNNEEITVEGEFRWKFPETTPFVADSNTTEYAVTFTPTGEDAENYSPLEIKVKVSVDKAPLNVKADDKEMTYRTERPAFTYTVGEGELKFGDSLTNALSGTPESDGNDTANAGTYSITKGTLAATENYRIESYTPGTLSINKAEQSAPAAGSGVTLSGGKIDIADTTNENANNETYYEVTDGVTTWGHEAEPFVIDAGKSYKIRWAGSGNYNASPWTDIITTAGVTASVTPEGAGSIALTNGGRYPLTGSVTITAEANGGYRFASWQDGSGRTLSYDAAYTFTITGDTVLRAVFVDRSKTVVQLPEVIATGFTYDGNEKTAVTVSENCIITDNKARDAGNYTATAELSEGAYIWADGTTEVKTFPWSIGKADQGKPAVTVTEGGTFTITAGPAADTVIQDPPLVVYYSQDSRVDKSLWTQVPEGGITDAEGIYYFYTGGNNNYNDSPVETKSTGIPVTAATLQPTGLTTVSAALNGSVSDAGKVSEVWFEWKAVEADSRTKAPGEGETPVTVASAFSHTLNGLSADTEYEYHTVAKLTSGRTISGNEIRFRTPKETPPTGSVSVNVISESGDKGVVVSVEEGNISSVCSTSRHLGKTVSC